MRGPALKYVAALNHDVRGLRAQLLTAPGLRYWEFRPSSSVPSGAAAGSVASTLSPA